MSFQIKPYPDFSWSQSRDALLQECARKYFYNYYAAHNGWLDSATPLQRDAYLLKQLANLHLVLGSVIHEMANDVITKMILKQPYQQATAWIQTVKDRLNQAYRESKDVNRWRNAPKKSLMLHEMYYEQALQPKLVQQIKDKIEPCVRNLYSCQTVREITEQEVLLIEAEQMKTTPFENEQIYVIPDLVYKRPDGVFVIVDWKTGKEYEQNEHQTLLYAMYASEHYQVDINQIEIRLEYLNLATSKTIIPDRKAMEDTKQWVRTSIDTMKRLLENEAMNKPLEESFFAANPSAFKCKSCNFREICPDKSHEITVSPVKEF